MVEDVAQPVPGGGTTYIPAGADTTGLTPASAPVAPPNRRFASVTVTNNYAGPTNRISVTKNVIGTPPAGTQYTFNVTCISSTAALAPYVDTARLERW